MFFSLVLFAFAIDLVLAHFGLDRPVRSGLWLTAVLGPYNGFLIFGYNGGLVLGQIVGALAVILAFVLGYFLEIWRARRELH